MPDWIDANAYRYTKELTASQWAWEFLRRNPKYRNEWQAFIKLWRELEATYGKPSKRDISAWTLDPRAWVSEEACSSSDCKVDRDKVLIECALGARWGFYKFPPDPADDDPVGEGRLTWRKVESDTHLINLTEYTHKDSVESALISYDLSLPLAAQLSEAKRQLQIEQRRLIKSGMLLPPRISAHTDSLCRKLRILDAIAASVQTELIRLELYPGLSANMLQERQAALRLRDHEYRRLLLFEEGSSGPS